MPVSEFVHAYQKTDTARRMQDVLDMPYDKAASPEGALVSFFVPSIMHRKRLCDMYTVEVRWLFRSEH